MSINRVVLSSTIGQYGVKLSYTDQGRPLTSFTLVCEDPGRDGQTFKCFILIMIVGSQAEALAERLEPGDGVLLQGKRADRAGKMKASGKLVVTCFGVEVLTAAAASTPEG